MKSQIICSILLITCVSTLQAETQTCHENATLIVEQMQTSGDYPAMTERENKIARQAAITACDKTFAQLETDLEAAQNSPKTEQGIDPETDPIGWLKEQWHKEPINKKGVDRLKNRRR